MSVTNVTREELWAKQHLSCKNMDYAVWERDKSMLQKLSRINGGCSFVVDVYKGCYAYASTGFVWMCLTDTVRIPIRDLWSAF